MSEREERSGADGAGMEQSRTMNSEADGLEAEQESAEAMDAEVVHGDAAQSPQASETTEGQPS